MPRGVSWGTPGRTQSYTPLRGKWAFVLPALVLAAAAFLGLLLLHALGWRGSVSPGAVASAHAAFESRCEECHTARAGVVDVRCQRCHDPSGAGRLTNAAHVLVGSGDASKANAAPAVACARCHVDHRGSTRRLAEVEARQCSACHFRSLSSHPEFAVLRSASLPTPGIKFSHERHVKELLKRGGTEKDACLKCHEPVLRGDIEPIVFDRHCASCHAKDGSLGLVEPVPQEDVVPPAELLARGGYDFRLEEFDTSRGRIAKATLRHRDDWVLFNLRTLRRELDPAGFAAERGALQSREAQLRRRLALAAPLAGLDLEALRAREQALAAELAGLETRLAAQARAFGPASGLDRIAEVAAAAAASADATARDEAKRLEAQAEALRPLGAPAAALPAADREARKTELLTLLDAIEAADPELKPRAEDLRRRLLALSAGESPGELLGRVRDQRAAERARVQDEIALRASGVQPPPMALLAGEQRALRDALAAVQERLALLSDAPEPKGPLGDELLRRKRETFEVLSAACRKCHVATGVALAPLRAARPRLVRASFVHAPHLLQAECARCHAGVEQSKEAAELSFKGIASCRECHRPGAARADCQVCHRYHPRVTP